MIEGEVLDCHTYTPTCVSVITCKDCADIKTRVINMNPNPANAKGHSTGHVIPVPKAAEADKKVNEFAEPPTKG